MAQYDVYRFEGEYALDCQADIHRRLAARLIVPLLAVDDRQIKQRLNPIFEIGGARVAMRTEFAVSVFAVELGEPVYSLQQHEYEIQGALDVLLTGV